MLCWEGWIKSKMSFDANLGWVTVVLVVKLILIYNYLCKKVHVMRKMACLSGWREKFGNSLHAYNTQHTKRHSLLWENRKQTEVGVKWSKIISRSSILHWSRAIGWTQKECRMPRYLKSLALRQAAGFYHIPIRSVGHWTTSPPPLSAYQPFVNSVIQNLPNVPCHLSRRGYVGIYVWQMYQ